MTLLLALDTATTLASLALHDGARVRAETSWIAGRDHTTQLLVEIDHLLVRVGCRIEDVDGLGVAKGPGSFTGVRVGMSVAKGLAVGLGVPLWGATTLAILAASVPQQPLPVRPLVDAGRNRFATVLYRLGEEVEPMRNLSVADVAATLAEPTILVGDLDPNAHADLATHPLARVALPAASVRRASFLAELALRARADGDPGDPASLDAVYVGRS